MIIYSLLGKKGNFGNQLFQIASTIGIATKNGHEFAFQKWEYAKYFNHNFPLYDSKIDYQIIREKGYHYSNIELKQGNYDLIGWFQSEKYFNIEVTKMYFKFQTELINEVQVKCKNALLKKNILISIRRGDFVNHPYYHQLDYKYYFLAITTQFSDWEERNLIFTSDDIAYCKRHFEFLPNAVFVNNLSAIEQLVLGSLCDDFVISNSTFSWWLAWFGEKEVTKIIRPIQNFRGKFRVRNSDKDYFPERWLAFNSKAKKMGLKYSRLIIKGEFFKIVDTIKYYYNFLVKQFKKIIKKLIGRK